MYVPATVGTAVPLVLLLSDGNESQYPQAEVYAEGGTTPVATLDLPHKAQGRYEDDWTPSSTGVYSVIYIVYSDSGHTTENTSYSREADQVFVTLTSFDELAAALARLLGLSHENAFIDNTEFDAFGSMVSARVRIFNSKTNAEAATDGGSETTGLLATYQVTTTYSNECRMGTYRMVREP